MNLDEIDPAHCRTFAIQGVSDHARGRLVAVEQRQNRPGVQAEGHALARLAPAILKQPRRHTAAGKTPS